MSNNDEASAFREEEQNTRDVDPRGSYGGRRLCRCDRGGRGGGRDHASRGHTYAQRVSNFKEETSDMNGRVFQCHSETSDPR